MKLYGLELAKAAHEVIDVLCRVKKDEVVVITADTKSDEEVANALAQEVYALGAKPVIMWMPTPPGPGAIVDKYLATDVLKGALLAADCWIELNYAYIFYSQTHEYVMKNNKRLRFYCLPNMHTDVFVRLFANTDHVVLRTFLDAVRDKIRAAKHVRLTSETGEDIEFDNHPDHPINSRDGFCDVPGSHMLSGMISWAPDLDTINGVIVFDGSLVPQFGIVESPVKVYMKNGVIDHVEGGHQAVEWEQYMRAFNHPQMLRPAHVCVGFHPGAKLTGQLGEDERLWGGSQWGFGNIGSLLIPPDGVPAPSHVDGTCVSVSLYLDGVQITNNGVIIDPELKELAKTLGK